MFVKSGPITNPDRLFMNLSEDIFDRYAVIGMALGLKSQLLANELETGEFKMWKGSRKALKMLQLWKQSVTEDQFTYAVLAAALEEAGSGRCADKYCYNSGNHMTIYIQGMSLLRSLITFRLLHLLVTSAHA